MEQPNEIVKRLAASEPVRGILASAAGRSKDLAALARKLCEVPAPTFREGPRAEAVAAELKWLGIQHVEKDELGNVLATMDFSNTGASVLVAAHLDTVFPEGTPCKVEERAGWLYGPGIGDNAASQAVALIAAEYLHRHRLPEKGRVTLAFTVCEEGLGNLRGMRHICERMRGRFDVALGIDGDIGQVMSEPVGSRRYRLAVIGPGGHSWSDFGRPSALHAMIQIAEPLTRVKVPAQPRTTFNIGRFSGGTSINSIAAEAEMLLDLRSVDDRALAAVEAECMALVRDAELPPGLSLQIQRVGDRPVGDRTLARMPVEVASSVLRALGCEVTACASSTDANIPLSLGVPATTMGVRRGVGVHSPNEGIEIASLGLGLQATLLTILALSEAYSAVPVRKGARR